MAKKSPSAAKKSKPSKPKATAKPVKKPVIKALKKLAPVAAKKVIKVVSGKKPLAAKVPKAAVAKVKAEKVPKKSETAKPAEKNVVSKPALMTKKGKALPVEAIAVDTISEDSVEAPVKAEKASKVKPIRIEKGNIDDEKAKWAELFKKLGKDKAVNYKMSDTFSALSPVQHKVLGWGFILKNDNDRLEVLFETGIRMLISNYKS